MRLRPSDPQGREIKHGPFRAGRWKRRAEVVEQKQQEHLVEARHHCGSKIAIFPIARFGVDHFNADDHAAVA